MNIKDAVAVITGADGGIGRALAMELAKREIGGMALVDQKESVQSVAKEVNEYAHDWVAVGYSGDAGDAEFRRRVYKETSERCGLVNICVPAAGITCDGLAVKLNKQTNRMAVYPEDMFRQVMEVNLVAPVYWALEMVAAIAASRMQAGLQRWEPTEAIQGSIVFIGSVSSLGNKGQIAYSTTKAGLEGATATMMTESMYYGVRCSILHPGFTDTPMVRALGDEFIQQNITPRTQLRRLIRPEEIADAVCFMISNVAVSGSLWADAGWHRPA